MEMEHHHYGMGDLRHFMNPTTSGNLFTPAISHPELLSTSTDGHHHHHQSNDDDPPEAAAQAQARPQSQAQQLEMLISTSSRHQMSTTSPCGGLLNHHHHHHHHLFRTEPSSGANNFSIGGGSSSCLSGDGFGFDSGNGSGRWPRQETLTLLEVRSRLDSKFKEANQKGPLWDQVSRIMCEEHGYQRSGKKCREKFENLYKYYKKTKEGKAGRQDGKHYRFFRQLEALYGESSTTNPTTSLSETPHLGGIGSINFPYTTAQPDNLEVFHQPPRQLCDDSLTTPSNSSAFYTSSSDDCCSEDLNAAAALKRRGKRSWKTEIRDFLDRQMRKLMEKQETWLEKMMKSIEQKEQERMSREEEWRKQEAVRMDREHKFWAKERAWIESRDAGLMEALHRLTGLKELKVASNSSPETDRDQELVIMRADQVQNDNGSETITNSSDSWQECEITRLIQLRTSMEPMFVQQSGVSEGEVLWEEIASNLACLGYENRTAAMCKDKWDSISNYLMKNKDQCSIKKRKENDNNSISSSYFYFQNNESICNNQGEGGGGAHCENNELGGGGLVTRSLVTQSEHHVNASRPPPMQGSSFRFMGDEAENLWENYGLKLSKGDN